MPAAARRRVSERPSLSSRGLAYDSRWLGADHRRVKGFIGLAGPYDFLPFTGAVTHAAFKGALDPAST